jgi:hypothetical protein
MFGALRSSHWAYPLLEVVHIFGIALLVGNLVALELRVFGRAATLQVQGLARLSLSIALSGFALVAVSGLLMFVTQPSEMLANRAFLIKMGLVAAAGCNAIQMLTSTAIWFAVIFCGRWIAY